MDVFIHIKLKKRKGKNHKKGCCKNEGQQNVNLMWSNFQERLIESVFVLKLNSFDEIIQFDAQDKHRSVSL